VRRGDVHALGPAPPARGREQHGRRYAVIVQTDFLSELSTVVVAPTSTSALPTVFRPAVEAGDTARSSSRSRSELSTARGSVDASGRSLRPNFARSTMP